MVAAAILETVACAVCGEYSAEPARARAPRDECATSLGLPGGRSSWKVCSGCGLVFQSPRPGPEAIETLYAGGEYHEARGGVPDHYIRYSLRRSQAALAWALDGIGLDRPAGRALDIGCGVGGALVDLRERGWDVVGVEPDPSLAAVARSRFGLDVRGGVLAGDTFAASEMFDLAYSCHVYEHLTDPVTTSRIAHRLLRDRRGHILIVVPTFRHARTLAWACFTAPHMYMFTDVSLSNVLDLAGFDTVARRFDAASGDSELWLLARAREATTAAKVESIRPEKPNAIQRELALVPLFAPLGVPPRLARHARTLVRDPRDFIVRVRRRLAYQVARARRARGLRR